MRRVQNLEFKHGLWLDGRPMAFLNDQEREHLLETIRRDIEMQARKEEPVEKPKSKGARITSGRDVS